MSGDEFTGLRVSPHTKEQVAALTARLLLPQHLVIQAAVSLLDRVTADERVETQADRAARLAGLGGGA